MVHGRAREPPRQTWRVAVDEGRLRVLVVGVLSIVMVAHCDHKAVEGCIWHNTVSLNFLWLWHAVVFLTCMTWIWSWFWKQDPKLHWHDITWAFEAIMSLWHLSALLTVLDHFAVYGRFLRAKSRVSELEVRYTVPEVKGGDGIVVVQTPFSKIITDASHNRVGQEYSFARDLFKDPSQWVLVPVSAPFLPKKWSLECEAQGFLYRSIVLLLFLQKQNLTWDASSIDMSNNDVGKESAQNS